MINANYPYSSMTTLKKYMGHIKGFVSVPHRLIHVTECATGKAKLYTAGRDQHYTNIKSVH